MIEKASNNMFNHYLYTDNSQESQMRRAGLVFKTDIQVDGYLICDECVKAGKADFLCALCNTRKSTDKIQESIGDPPEHLCKDCYNTVTAKVWEKKYTELLKSHTYDYE